MPMFLEFSQSAARSNISVRNQDMFRDTASNASIGSTVDRILMKSDISVRRSISVRYHESPFQWHKPKVVIRNRNLSCKTL